MLLSVTRRLGLLLLAVLCLGREASAQLDPTDLSLDTQLQQGSAGTRSLSLQLGFYDNGDDGTDGNPFLDESLTVVEPVVIYDHNVSDTFGYTAKLSYDFVSSASIERLSEFDGQSGASRDNYIGADVAFRHVLSSSELVGWRLHYSNEYDYNSLGLGGNWVVSPKGTDATVSVSLDGYYDLVDVIRFDGSEEDTESRASLAATVNWYQILSPTMHGQFGVTLSHQDGFLETPYNFVTIEDGMSIPGTMVPEQLPDSRSRGAIFARLRKRLAPGHAVELGGRLYTDSWDLSSFSIEPRYYQTLIKDRLMARYRYRYYSQSEAKQFSSQFTAPEEFLTQDSDLGEFDTNMFGMQLIWWRPSGSTFNVSLDYALRSDGLDHVFGSIGWKWNF